MTVQEFFFAVLRGFGVTDPLALNVALGVFFGILATKVLYSVLYLFQGLIKIHL